MGPAPGAKRMGPARKGIFGAASSVKPWGAAWKTLTTCCPTRKLDQCGRLAAQQPSKHVGIPDKAVPFVILKHLDQRGALVVAEARGARECFPRLNGLSLGADGPPQRLTDDPPHLPPPPHVH